MAGLLVWSTAVAGEPTPNRVTAHPFGKTPDGVLVTLYTLSNSRGAEARIMDYGGTLVSLSMPDKAGIFTDVVLGFDTLAEYISSSPYYGSIIGRCGNRIKSGHFKLEGKEYTLAANFRGHHLHGGVKGFDKRMWTATPSANALGASLELTYVSPDGEEGYPGTLTVKALYTLTDQNELKLDFSATTDKPTLCNLTHHAYFNVSGKGEVLNQRLMIPAGRFTPVDKEMIPTGEIRSVAGTPLDFRHPTAVGAVIQEDDEQLKIANGFDHNWAFDKKPGELTLLARVEDPDSGRILEVLSTAPGLQVYTADFGDGSNGKSGQVYRHRASLCLEPQGYPDAPNHPQFPSVVLKPGEICRNTIIYRFEIVKN